MSASDYLENKVLGYVYGGAAFVQPTGRYIALYTAAPTDAGGGTEISTTGTAYVRQALTFTVSGTAPTQAANSAQVDFPAATASWGTITHFAIFDAASAGNMLNWGALTASKTIATGDVFRVVASSIVITLD